jgi:hypothetical protein
VHLKQKGKPSPHTHLFQSCYEQNKSGWLKKRISHMCGSARKNWIISMLSSEALVCRLPFWVASISASSLSQMVCLLFVSNCHTYNFVVCCAGRDAPCNPFFIWVYWINVSLGAVFGVMAILIALLTNVFGQGLALRGPLGSMV